ncbi:MAG: lactonase family protein [Lentisphaerales bacterium]|nr:lactonase family protein [Lentisphaerales bacterium]
MPDLGRDLIQVFEVQGSKLKHRSDLDYKSKIDAGPRHFTFHPNGKSAYLINERSFTLTAFSYANGQLTPTDTKSCLPKDFKKAIVAQMSTCTPKGNLSMRPIAATIH